MPKSQPAPPRRRGYRMGDRAEAVAGTRAAIVEAAIEIGDPRATIDQIAERAGVSSRTVLRQFGSRAGVTAAAIEVADSRIRRQRFAAEPGDVEDAVKALVTHYEEHGDQAIRRLADEGGDAEVDELLESGRRMHREWVGQMFGSLLADLNRSDRRRRLGALTAVCDVYTWKLLRRDQGLGATETRKAIAELIRGITDGGLR